MNKTVLITGATSGIGLELAKIFAENKFDLVIISRNEIKLKEISDHLENSFKIKVKYIAKDLSQPLSAEEIFDELKKVNVSIDILVNNAGFGNHGAFTDTDLKNDVDMIGLNITSLVILTKLFLINMKKNNAGKIMNVASTAAFQPGPFMSVYYATKSFVLSFSEALAEELSDTNISVTTLCPGPTKTDFQYRAAIEKTKLVNMKLSGMMSAEEVAKAGYKGLMKGKRIVIPGTFNKILPQLVRFVPRSIVTKITKNIHLE